MAFRAVRACPEQAWQEGGERVLAAKGTSRDAHRMVRVFIMRVSRPGARPDRPQRWMTPLDTLTRSPSRNSGVVSWVITWVLPSSMRTVMR